MRIQTFQGCHGSVKTVMTVNRSLEQRNLRGGPTTLERQPITGARRE